MTEWLKRGMRWIVAGFVAVMVLGLAATPARGQDVRYVRTTGNDSAAGTSPATAWRTISFAATQATAGMTVYVGAGTYTEFVTTSAAGTAGSPIRFIADASGSQTGDTGAVRIERSGTVILIDDNLWTFQGFEIDANSYGDAVRVSAATGVILDSCLIEDASSSSGSLVRVENGGAVRVTGCRLRNTRHAVRLDNGDADVLSSIVTGCSGDVFTLKSSSCELTLIASTVVGGGDDGVDAAAGTATVHNTIIADLVDDALAQRGSSTITHTHNLYHDISGTTFNGTSQHSSELLVDPIFVGSGDYGLAEGSPATDAGMDVSSWVSLDYAGASRPGGGGWDIGAYESDAVLGYRPPPIAHWRLDEIIGPAAPDSSGGGRHGTVQSGAAWSARGQFGTSLAFNGVGGWVEVVDDAAMRFAADKSYSVSAWVYVPALGAARSRGVVAKGERDWGIWLNASDRWVAGGETDLVGPIAASGWSHVAVTQDGDAGTRALYVDGVEVATGVAAAADGAGPLWIGAAYPSGEAFAGNIDDVRVWDRAIGVDEVAELATPTAYHVRTTGSNGLAGTSPATAWRTIEYALATATPGSTIYVGGGTYVESISSSHRATEASPTRVIADTTGAETGDAGVVVIAPSSLPALSLDAASHVQWRGLTFQGSGDGSDVIDISNGIGSLGFFECTISDAAGDEGLNGSASSTVLIAGTTIGPVGGSAVSMDDGSLGVLGSTFTDSLDGIHIDSGATAVLNGFVSTGHTQEGLTVEGTATAVNGVVAHNNRRGVEVEAGGTVTAYHLTVHGNGDDQIRMSGNQLVLRNSVV
ncbi:MAG: LamG domain-containing protein [Planctomycetota bacterium]